jgi:hypothetical protein
MVEKEMLAQSWVIHGSNKLLLFFILKTKIYPMLAENNFVLSFLQFLGF